MSFFLTIVELLLFGLTALDTLSFVVFNKKNPEKTDVKDYTQVCFRWVFLLILKSLSCSSCSGALGFYYGFVLLLAKLYVTIPLLNGTQKLYNFFTNENGAMAYVRRGVEMVKQRMGCCNEVKTE